MTLYSFCSIVRNAQSISGRRRAIATVVSGAILLTTVTIIGAGAVSWTQNTVNVREHDLGSYYSSTINKIKESLALERFWYDTSNQKLNLVLKNNGDIGLNVVQIAIAGRGNQTITTISNAGIDSGSFYTAKVKYDWLGDPIDVFVTTARGSIFRMHLVSPVDGVLIIKKVSILGNGNFSYNGDLGKFNVTTAGYTPGTNLDKNGNLIMSGVIRDVNGTGYPCGNPSCGHPDFEMPCPCPFGLYPGIVLTNLGSDREPVYDNQTNSPFNHGFVRFNQWYHDSPYSVKENLNVTLIKQPTVPTTTWAYTNFNFFPIDNQLWGADGNDASGKPHNYSFTYEVHSTFTYQGGETFSFTGDDDVFVFINDKLVIDLGGVHAAASASVNLDTLGLTKGNTYDFDFFYAERHTVASDMKITTSIKLNKSGSGRTSAFFVDPGTYTINELVPAGWKLVNRQCDNGFTLPNSTEITVTVPKGVTTCTFTNSL